MFDKLSRFVEVSIGSALFVAGVSMNHWLVPYGYVRGMRLVVASVGLFLAFYCLVVPRGVAHD